MWYFMSKRLCSLKIFNCVYNICYQCVARASPPDSEAALTTGACTPKLRVVRPRAGRTSAGTHMGPAGTARAGAAGAGGPCRAGCVLARAQLRGPENSQSERDFQVITKAHSFMQEAGPCSDSCGLIYSVNIRARRAGVLPSVCLLRA